MARSAKLTDIRITNTPTDILLDLKITGAFSREIQEAIFSGVPTTFSYFILFERNRGIWPNQTLVDVTLTHTIKYNALKKEFAVTRSWDEDGAPIFLRDFTEAGRLMTEIHGFRLVGLDALEQGESYDVRVKAKLTKISLPFYLHYFMMMASVWEFETDWHILEFDY